MHRVPLLDTTRSLATLEPELTAAFVRVLRSGQYILGAEVSQFEAAVAQYSGAAHAVGVSSGTDALLVALQACNVGPGQEVVVPSYTFFASAGSIWRLGAKPVFVDSCPGCFNVLPAAVQAALTPRTTAVMPVHLFGQMAAMEALGPLCDSAGVAVVEDAAQALGARLQRQAPAGPHGARGLVCYSFFPSKNLGAFGDAGMVTTQDAATAETLRMLRMHGAKPKYHHSLVGGNFRLDALQAALLQVKLPHLEAACSRRRHNAGRYTEAFLQSGLAQKAVCICDGAPAPRLDAPLVLPSATRGRHAFNQYVIRINSTDPTRRDAVRAALQAQNIGCEIYYPIPLHLQACFAALEHRPGDLPHAELAATQTLALPIFAELIDAEIDCVVAAVLQAVAG
jgi:dTDP-4-amino-4,6-dideoxygalactose transaminase